MIRQIFATVCEKIKRVRKESKVLRLIWSTSMDTAVGCDQFYRTEDVYDVYGVRWGGLKPVKTERYTYYQSFHLIEEEYCVKDIVYLQASDGPPYIARIEELRENIKTRKKTMLVRWFFRPCELPEGLPNVDYSETSKEVFMAADSERSKMFQNPACTIKKCTVLCITNETWNIMPSPEQVAAADHVYDRAFDPVKLRLERLDPSVETGDFLRISYTKKKPKVGRSTCTGQAVKGRNGEVSRYVGAMSKYSGLHSNMVVMGGPPNQFSGLEADHTCKRISSQKSATEVSLIQGKTLQRVESRKRPRGDTSEEKRPRKAKLGDVKNDQERSSKFTAKQFPTDTDSQKRLKLDVPLTGKGEARKSQIATLKAETEKVKPSGQSRDRLLKTPILDGKNTVERKHGGSVPITSSLSSGKHTSMTGDGRAREVAILGKRSREDGPPSSTTKKRLADDPRSKRRVSEVSLESKHLRPNVFTIQRSGLLEHKRSEGAVKEGLREERYGASSVKSLREATSGTNQSKVAQVHHRHQHLSSTSMISNGQYGHQAKGKGGGTCREDTSRPVKKGDKSRDSGEDEASRKLKPRSCSQDLSVRLERNSDRDLKVCEPHHDFHRAVEGFCSAPDHGRALSTDDNNKLFMPSKKIFKFPWDEKKSVVEAISNGRALLLKNLDPYLNSAELEAILENVLDITCDVRMLPPKSITRYHSVEAIVIFKRAEIAEDVLSTLLENLLVISEDERPVLASKLKKQRQNIASFHGFFNPEKFGWKTNANADQKNAVATSHCAQTNTVEYDMGLLWRVLQEQSEMEWKILEEEHVQEIQKLKAKYRKCLK